MIKKEVKAIIYLRTSTLEQKPENQLADIKTIATDGGEVIVTEKESAWRDKEGIASTGS